MKATTSKNPGQTEIGVKLYGTGEEADEASRALKLKNALVTRWSLGDGTVTVKKGRLSVKVEVAMLIEWGEEFPGPGQLFIGREDVMRGIGLLRNRPAKPDEKPAPARQPPGRLQERAASSSARRARNKSKKK
jgi:hypothetical protein